MHRSSSHAASGRRCLVPMAVLAATFVISQGAIGQVQAAAPASPSSRIVGGIDVNDGKYPFLVSLRDANNKFWCGASVVSPTVLMTAAHCIGVINERGNAVVGRTDMSDLTRGTVHKFTTIFVHPGYGAGLVRDANDLAFIELKTPIAGVEPIATAPSQAVDALAGVSATVAGWGALRERGNGPDRLQEVGVDILPSAQCRQAYGSNYDESTMFCASRPRKDSCQGDSGGPIFLKPLDGTPPIQVGVVSWGAGCARPESPGVYTRLDSAALWDGLGKSATARRIRALVGR